MAKVKSKKAAMWQRTLVVTFIVVIVGFLYAAGYLVRWQIVMGEELKTKAMNQSLQSTNLTAMRGTIYDATGTKVLAQSASVWTVALEPTYIESEDDREKIARGLSEILELDYNKVLDKSNENSAFTYLKRKVETEKKDEILKYLDDNDIERGVRLIEDYKRYYPYGSTASVVLGFTGTDNNGLAGIELEYETQLSGTKGRMVSAKNAIGTDMPFKYEQLISADDGYDLVLTIDETVQNIVEKHLNEGAEKYSVKNGAAAIVMNVKTGAIVALAMSDSFDANDPFTIVNQETQSEIDSLPEDQQDDAYEKALQKQWRNKAISDTYVPGSTFKMVTGSMALDCGAITPETTFECGGAYVPYPGVDPIKCWIYPRAHGTETVKDGICNSCNPFMMQIAQKMGPHTFFSYFEAFGFTKKTGIDLPGEGNSVYHSEEQLQPVELATDSFGQGNTITPIQMITATAAVANGGYIVQPHVVSRILDSDGNIISTTDTSYKRQVISEEVSREMTSYLQENATSGSGKNGYVAGYRVCGKTGTSEKIAEHWADPSKPMEYIASFSGFAPAEDPQYALLVFFDEPDRNTASGGAMAAPVFAAIMKEILPYLGVESQLDASEQDSWTTAPNVIGKKLSEAKNILAESGLESDVYNKDTEDDTVVVMQVPSAGAEMPVEGKVVLYTEDSVDTKDLLTVPDFMGKSLADCNYEATNAGLQILVSGASTSENLQAQNQDIQAGEKVKPGTVITVTFVDTSGLE